MNAKGFAILILLSSPQDRRQNEESGFYAVSSPSPRDEGVGRGTGEPVNTARKLFGKPDVAPDGA